MIARNPVKAKAVTTPTGDVVVPAGAWFFSDESDPLAEVGLDEKYETLKRQMHVLTMAIARSGVRLDGAIQDVATELDGPRPYGSAAGEVMRRISIASNRVKLESTR